MFDDGLQLVTTPGKRPRSRVGQTDTESKRDFKYQSEKKRMDLLIFFPHNTYYYNIGERIIKILFKFDLNSRMTEHCTE